MKYGQLEPPANGAVAGALFNKYLLVVLGPAGGNQGAVGLHFST